MPQSLWSHAVDAYIGLGANLGDARSTVLAAMDALQQEVQGVRVCQRSSLYASAPLEADGGDYVNAVVHLQTTLEPRQLLAVLQSIEAQAGRVRSYRNAPRTLDLDLLLYGALELDSDTLVLPHPRMWQREFVLLPLAEIAPNLVTPAQLLAVQGQGVRLLSAPLL